MTPNNTKLVERLTRECKPHAWNGFAAHLNPDGPEAAALIEELVEALRKLSFAAQTTGGTAGRDEQLVAAIDEAAAALERARA